MINMKHEGRIDHYHHQAQDYSDLCLKIGAIAETLIQLKEYIMVTSTQFAADLVALKAQADKAKAEIVAKIAELEAAVTAGGAVSQEVLDAFAELKGSVQGIDDIRPDGPSVIGTI